MSALPPSYPYRSAFSRLYFTVALLALLAGIILISTPDRKMAPVGGLFCFILSLIAFRTFQFQRMHPFLQIDPRGLVIHRVYRSRLYPWLLLGSFRVHRRSLVLIYRNGKVRFVRLYPLLPAHQQRLADDLAAAFNKCWPETGPGGEGKDQSAFPLAKTK